MQEKTIARVPLFDRFDDNRKHVEQDDQKMNFSQESLEHSIQQEVFSLLNTFCLLPFDELKGQERTSLTYGIPDFSCISFNDVERYQQLSQIIAESITTFEPRLDNVHVEIESNPEPLVRLWVKIKAHVVVGADRIPFFMNISRGDYS